MPDLAQEIENLTRGIAMLEIERIKDPPSLGGPHSFIVSTKSLEEQ